MSVPEGGAARAKLFTIPAGAPFADAIARQLMLEAGDDPLALAAMRVFTPTRRAGRTLREAFLRVGAGRPLLLPAISAVGAEDEDGAETIALAADAGSEALSLAPAVRPLSRLMTLTRMVRAWAEATGAPFTATGAAAALARSLALLIDEVATEGLDLDRIREVGPASPQMEAHWQAVLAFLEIALTSWPAHLAERGAMDPARRRDLMIRARGRAVREGAGDRRIVAAGSTGTIPSTAELLEAVALAANGAVVLPGLDRDLAADAWADIGPEHPQFGMKALLERIGVDRAEVGDWPGVAARQTRRVRLIGEALRPAEATHDWRAGGGLAREDVSAAVEGLHVIEAPTPRSEAVAIALVMREALETPGRTTALVTPDRTLARRVVAALRRWGVEADDSAGQPLGETPPATFLRLLAGAAAEGFAPTPLLALAKHPLCAAGLAPGALRRQVRLLERLVLRGPRPAAGFAGLSAAISLKDAQRRPVAAGEEDFTGQRLADAAATVDRLAQAVGAFAAMGRQRDRVPLRALVEAHLEAAEALARSEGTPGADRLWSGDAGLAVAQLFAGLLEAADDLGDIAPLDYRGLVEALIDGETLRRPIGLHPRAFVWGPLEARLQSADVTILGGLNEGVWPGDAGVDPWLSRPMRKAFGLPAPERQIGLAAHDFAQGAAGESVFLTRAARSDDGPAVASRWLLRLRNLVKGLGLDPVTALAPPRDYAGLAITLDRSDGPPEPCAAPRPSPPVAARPRRLSVTRVETLIRDPYAIYAQEVLRLRSLDPLDGDPGAAERGQLIHAILEDFVAETMDGLPDDARARLDRIAGAAFAPYAAYPAVAALWRARFDRAADWFLDTERDRRTRARPLALEVFGKLEFDAPGGAFELTAIADRIDRAADGRLVIYDYKTGAAPSQKQVESGWAQQLPLEAAIADCGGFADLPRAATADLVYIQIKGLVEAGKETRLKLDPAEAAADAYTGLEALIGEYDDAERPYLSKPRVQFASDHGDYDHLARTAEWSAGRDGEGEA